MGAHVGHGGKVVTDGCGQSCLECPFHGWKFRVDDGQCTKTAANGQPPSGVGLKEWPSIETNGFVFVWFHAENEPSDWLIPTIPEIITGQWKYLGRTEDTVRCFLQEIPENGADVHHLDAVHRLVITCNQIH